MKSLRREPTGALSSALTHRLCSDFAQARDRFRGVPRNEAAASAFVLARRAPRQERAPAQVVELHMLREKIQAGALPKYAAGKTVSCTLTRRRKLTR
ncbi:MAG: hypothetical protein ACP5FH_07045 [Terracidiphilus sp.]